MLKVPPMGAGACEFEYFGPALARLFGKDYTGTVVEEAAREEPKIATMLGFYQKVMERHSPVSEASEFFLDEQQLRYRSVIAPMSTDGEHIDRLIGTTNYKVFA